MVFLFWAQSHLFNWNFPTTAKVYTQITKFFQGVCSLDKEINQHVFEAFSLILFVYICTNRVQSIWIVHIISTVWMIKHTVHLNPIQWNVDTLIYTKIPFYTFHIAINYITTQYKFSNYYITSNLIEALTFYASLNGY